MATYKQVRILTSVEAAYIAGLIDGEGTISLTRRHRLENRQLVVSISSTEKCLLKYVQGGQVQVGSQINEPTRSVILGSTLHIMAGEAEVAPVIGDAEEEGVGAAMRVVAACALHLSAKEFYRAFGRIL